MVLPRSGGTFRSDYIDDYPGMHQREELSYTSVESNVWYGPDYLGYMNDDEEDLTYVSDNNCRTYIEELMYLRVLYIMFPRDKIFVAGKPSEELQFF